MSKCRPRPTQKLLALEKAGVVLMDISRHTRGNVATEEPKRTIEISIPYESLRDNKDVQIAFQDLVIITTD